MAGFAAIDCGTNSTRLLLADADGNPVARDYVVTRLGQGVDASGSLATEAIDRTVAAIEKFKATIDHHKVERVSIFATSAARDASNTESFFSAVEAVLGKRPALLSGEEEGQMTFAGAVVGMEASPVLVVDIGGGSTEMVVGPDPLVSYSMDIGAVRLTERFLHSDPFTAEELAAARSYIDAWIDRALAEVPAESTAEVVAVAGTASSLAMMDLGLTDYEPGCVHGHRLTDSALKEQVKALTSKTQADRLADPTIEPARADVLPAGALILESVLSRLGKGSCLVSETDNLDGAISQLRGL